MFLFIVYFLNVYIIALNSFPLSSPIFHLSFSFLLFSSFISYNVSLCFLLSVVCICIIYIFFLIYFFHSLLVFFSLSFLLSFDILAFLFLLSSSYFAGSSLILCVPSYFIVSLSVGFTSLLFSPLFSFISSFTFALLFIHMAWINKRSNHTLSFFFVFYFSLRLLFFSSSFIFPFTFLLIILFPIIVSFTLMFVLHFSFLFIISNFEEVCNASRAASAERMLWDSEGDCTMGALWLVVTASRDKLVCNAF